MAIKAKYKYPKNWFKHNLIAVPTDFVGGNCSACFFRNARKYCECLACTYIKMPQDPDYIASVYWIARETHMHAGMWPELVNFFNTTPKQKIRDISNDIMIKAVLAKKSEKTR